MALNEAEKTYKRKWNAGHREERRKYRVEHREEQKAADREYRKTDVGYALHRADVNRMTARRRGAVIDPELTNAILAQILRTRDSCEWCGNEAPLHDRMIDHRIAIVFGGQHSASNIQTLCKPCEKEKSSAEKSLASKLRNGATQSDFALVA